MFWLLTINIAITVTIMAMVGVVLRNDWLCSIGIRDNGRSVVRIALFAREAIDNHTYRFLSHRAQDVFGTEQHSKFIMAIINDQGNTINHAGKK